MRHAHTQAQDSVAALAESTDPGLQGLAMKARGDLPPHLHELPLTLALQELRDEGRPITDPMAELAWQLSRREGPLDSVLPPPGPSHNGQLHDVNHATLSKELSHALGVTYLSEASSATLAWPVRGIMYGPHCRPFVNLPTRIGRGPPRNVFYLVGGRGVRTQSCGGMLI